VEQILRAYLAHRTSPDELFFAFANRHELEALGRLVEEQTA
jgi:ferredoxin-nitrite reductase